MFVCNILIVVGRIKNDLVRMVSLKEEIMNPGEKFSVLSSSISTLEAEECASEMSSLAQ